MLGVARLVLLGHRDSALPGWPDATHRRALAAADPLVLARQVAESRAVGEGGGDLLAGRRRGGRGALFLTEDYMVAAVAAGHRHPDGMPGEPD